MQNKVLIISLSKIKRVWIALALALCWSLVALPTLAQKPGQIGQEATEPATATFSGAWHGYILIQWSADTTAAINERSEYLGPPHPYCDPDQGCYPTEMPTIAPPMLAVFDMLAPEHGSWPPYLLQIRWNLDYTAAIIEARFDVAISQENIMNLLAQHASLTASDLPDFTVMVFAPGGTWEESQQKCLEYLNANMAEWEQSAQ